MSTEARANNSAEEGWSFFAWTSHLNWKQTRITTHIQWMGRWRISSSFLNYITRITQSYSSKPLVPITHPGSAVSGRFFRSRPFSAIPSRVSVCSDDLYSGSFDFDHIHDLDAKEDEDTAKIPVKAYFLSTRWTFLNEWKKCIFFMGLGSLLGACDLYLVLF